MGFKYPREWRTRDAMTFGTWERNLMCLFTCVVLILLSLAFVNCSSTGPNANRDEDGIVLEDNTAPSVELHGLTDVKELPPIVPEARGRVSVTELVGPKKPHVTWNVPLPFSQPSLVEVVGVDGTVYLSGNDGVGAARDGKLVWAFHARDASQFLTLSDDGRLWFPSPGGGPDFSLNRNGEGGLLPRSIRRPPDAAEPPIAGCSGNGRWLRRPRSPDVALEYECTDPQAVLGPDSMAYVGTVAPDLRGVTAKGAVAWKFATPCAVTALLAGPLQRLLFSCQDQSLHFVEQGVLKWTKPGDGKITNGSNHLPYSSFVGLMDRNGTTYFADQPESGFTTHIHALSAAGDVVWTLKLSNFTANEMQFDKQGRLYLTGSAGRDRLVCISD